MVIATFLVSVLFTVVRMTNVCYYYYFFVFVRR